MLSRSMPGPASLHARLALAVLLISAIGAMAFPGDRGSMSDRRPLRVGPGLALDTPSAAAAIARDGDLVEIEAATYAGDAAVWRQNGLTIRGVGGRPHLRADGAAAQGKAIWVLQGRDITIENIEFSGARVPDGNGAAIRPEGAGVVLRDCFFHDNENGVMGGANPESDIVIENSEFARNGRGDGRTHNLYIGAVRSLRVERSYLHHAVVGHNLKSRALETTVVSSRIADEESGRSSYLVDLPNGGRARLIGNVIQQGPAAENSTLVSYGAEGLGGGAHELVLLDNTFVSESGAGTIFVSVTPQADRLVVTGNVFAGPGTAVRTPMPATSEVRDNRIVADARGAERQRAPSGIPAGLP